MKLCCPHCGVSGSTDDSYLGRTVQCPKCKNMFAVTAEEPQAPQEPGDHPEEAIAAAALSEDSAAPVAPEPTEESPWMQEEETGVAADLAELEDALPEAGLEELAEESTDEETLSWDDIQAEMDSAPAGAGLPEVEISEDESPAAMGGEADLAADVADVADVSEAGFADEPEDESVVLLEDDGLELEVEHDEAELDDAQNVVPEISLEDNGEALDTDEALILEEFEDESLVAAEGVQDEPVAEEPLALEKEKCSLCGKEDSVGEPFVAKDGRLYCTDCLPADEVQDEAATGAAAAAATLTAAAAGAAGGGRKKAAAEDEEMAIPPTPGHFTIGGALREAWSRTKGAKGSFWAFSAIMYLVLLIVVAGVTIVSNVFSSSGNVFLAEVGSFTMQSLVDFIAMLFSAGLLYMGVKRAVGQKITWRLGLTAFSYTGKIIVATVLQFVMVMIGYLLLILPGIYLSVGYAMTLPLIIDRGMSPWQAMEASRKAVHKVWWRVFGLYIVVSLLFALAMVPLFLGLIWAWPMLFILAGVVYRHLFGTAK